jgi:hypothetical protein
MSRPSYLRPPNGPLVFLETVRADWVDFRNSIQEKIPLASSNWLEIRE